MLAKKGYFGGDPQKVMRAPVGIVLKTIQYERFCDDVTEAYIKLNKEP